MHTSHYLPDTFSARSHLFIHPACPLRSYALMLAPDASGILNILWPSFPGCCWQRTALFVRSLYFPLSLEVSDCHRFSLLPGRCFAGRGRCKYCRGMPTIGGGGDVRQLPICWIVQCDELCVPACMHKQEHYWCHSAKALNLKCKWLVTTDRSERPALFKDTLITVVMLVSGACQSLLSRRFAVAGGGTAAHAEQHLLPPTATRPKSPL